MHVDTLLGSEPRVPPQRALVGRLITLAEDTDRAGLRQEASMLLAMAYSVLDGGQMVRSATSV
jgi:hypothetical protein